MNTNKKIKYAVQMKKITKSFCEGKIIANKDININVKYNEIHVICGENGAGKSTLMSILFGLYQPDKGEIYINEKKVNLKNPAQANELGLGMVHQHFKLINCFSILDNVILGNEKKIAKNGLLNRKKAKIEIEKICKEYDFKLDLSNKISLLSIGQQQKVEILKLLYADAKILIFDEPTAILSDHEILNFIKMLHQLKKSGKTIIFITHKIDEIKKIADSVTILRNGEAIKTLATNEIKKDKLIELLVGKEVIKKTTNNVLKHTKHPILEVRNLCSNKINNNKVKIIDSMNFKIYPGEIVGVAGIEGNGQSELALILTGILKPKNGSILYKNDENKIFDLTKLNSNKISKLGIAHIPEDRHKYGCILDETVEINLILNQIDDKKFSNNFFLKWKQIRLNAINLCSKFNILGANNGKAKMRSLSGGNQQKVVIARELTKKHSLTIMVQPTRGLDIKTVNNIHDFIQYEAKNNKAVLLISYELDEILKISNRIIVINKGKIVCDKPSKKINRNIIGKYLVS